MKLPLKKAVQALTETEKLSTEQLAQLLQLKPQRRSRSKQAFVAAASIVFVLLSVLGLDSWYQQRLFQAIADEVAYNHLTAKPMDVESKDIRVLAQFFASSGIQVRSVRMQRLLPLTLIGARHCSIQTVPAAQMRFLSETGKRVTLYEANYVSDRHGRLPESGEGESALELHSRGVNVRLWKEQGLVMATAETD